MKNILSHENSTVEEIITKNRYGIRNLQARYLQNQYGKMENAKRAERMNSLVEKERQGQMLKQLNKTYLNDVASNRKRKLQEMESLSKQYDDFMKNRQEKQKIDKLIEKNIEKSTLVAPTWVRDVFTQRQTYKKNMESYNRALADHVKLQQARKQIQKQEIDYQQKKLSLQADKILQKQIQQLEARHRQKSLFQQRQNKLLGVETQDINLNSSNSQPKQTILKRKQQELYSQGLSIQLKKQQEKRYSQEKMSSNNSNIYNPITNPIPFVYKNPNVLRMMAQN